MTPTNSSTAKPPAGVGVRYDETAALYTSQVVVNSIDDTVLLECSSGFVRSETGKTILPIEKRLAMNTDTARRLGNLLIEVADEMDQVDEQAEPCHELGSVWLSKAAKLQHNMRRALTTFPALD